MQEQERLNPAGIEWGGVAFSACVWLRFVHTGEMIMLDASDSTHNREEKSGDLNFSLLLTRRECNILNGITGAKHVKSGYPSSLKRPGPLADMAPYLSP